MTSSLSRAMVFIFFVCCLNPTTKAMERPDENGKSSEKFVIQRRSTSNTKQDFDSQKNESCSKCGEAQKKDEILIFVNDLARNTLYSQIRMLASANIKLITKIKSLTNFEDRKETYQPPIMPNTEADFDGCKICSKCGETQEEYEIFLLMNQLTYDGLEKKIKILLEANKDLKNTLKLTE